MNVVAVTTPVNLPSPTTDSFDVGFVVPIPTLILDEVAKNELVIPTTFLPLGLIIKLLPVIT